MHKQCNSFTCLLLSQQCDTKEWLYSSSSEARPRAQGAHQLRSLRGHRLTHGWHTLTLNLGLRQEFIWRFVVADIPTSDQRGGFPSQFQPFGGLPQLQPAGRGHVPIDISPDGIHTVPNYKEHRDLHAGRQTLRRICRSHAPSGIPREVRHITLHQIKTTLGPPVSCRPRRDTPNLSVQSAAQGGLTRMHPRCIAAPFRTTACPGRTHSPAASRGLHAFPNNRLPRTDSLACSLSEKPGAHNGLIRLQLLWTTGIFSN